MTQTIEYRGNTIEFDDDTPPEEIIEILEKSDIEEKTAPTNFADRLRLLGQGALLGYGDELTAGLRNLNPFSNRTYDDLLQEERDRIANFRQARPKESLALELGGGIASPVTKLGLVAKAPTLAKKGLQLAKEGGKVGFVYGTGSGEGVKDRLQKGSVGLVTGSVANPVLSKALQRITPQVKDSAKNVIERFGVMPSEARKAGGKTNEVLQSLEESLESVPVFGALTRNTRIKSRDKAVNRLINESVKKIDDNKSISEKLKPEQAIETASDIFDDAYDAVLPKMNISNRQALQSKVNQTLKDINNEFAYLSKAQMGKVKRDFQKVTQLGTKEKGITGEQLQRWNTDFNKLKKNYEKDPILQDVADTYFNNFKKEIYELATTNKPEVLTQWSKIQKAYSDFGTFADLVKKQKNITPRNIEKQARDRGRVDQAKGAKDIRDVFRRRRPDSGTAERVGTYLSLTRPEDIVKILASTAPTMLFNPILSGLFNLGRDRSARTLPSLLSTPINNPQGLLE